MDTIEFKSKYFEYFSNIKVFLKHKKNTYLRFRVNRSWGGAYDLDKLGETIFTELLREYTGDNNITCYGMFILNSLHTPLRQKVCEFLNKYSAKMIITQSHNIAGIKFSDPKYKELFLLRYKEYFPDSSLIK
jgi:hypothetical protein